MAYIICIMTYKTCKVTFIIKCRGICHSVNVTFMFQCTHSLVNKCLEVTFRGYSAFGIFAEHACDTSIHWSEGKVFHGNFRQAKIQFFCNNNHVLSKWILQGSLQQCICLAINVQLHEMRILFLNLEVIYLKIFSSLC